MLRFRCAIFPAVLPAALLTAGLSACVLGQDEGNAPEAGDLTRSARLERDRAGATLLVRIRKQLQGGETEAAVEGLQRLLSRDRDSFFVEDGHYRSLKEEANRLIREMSPVQARLYRRQYGPAARQALKAARSDDDLETLREVSVRYRHTRAGLAALQELAARAFDGGEVLVASAAWRRVTAHPLAEDDVRRTARLARLACRRLLDGAEDLPVVPSQHGDGSRSKKVTLGGRRVTPHEWLQELQKTLQANARPEPVVERGGPHRHATTPGTLPTMRATWRYESRPERRIKRLVDRTLGELDEQGVTPLCRFSPLVVGETVVARVLGHLVALDLHSGRARWDKAVGSRVDRIHDNPRFLQNAGFRRLYSEMLISRLQADGVTGTLSSDGTRVFAVIRTSGDDGPPVSTPLLPRGNEPAEKSMAGDARLVAYRLGDGTELWRTGPALPGENGREQGPGEVSFLGPPLPLGETLYAVGRAETEINLYALKARNGALRWSLSLAHAPSREAGAGTRLKRACPVVYGDGVLVCPTGAGAVLGVDLLTRSRLWACRYPRDDLARNTDLQLLHWRRASPMQWWESWRKATVIARQGRIVLAPPESDALHVLGLRTGEKQWSRPRKDGLFVAGAWDGRILVVGERSVRAFGIENGATAWEVTIGRPGGRGFASSTHYYLPLASGGVASIRLRDGSVHKTFPADGANPGNLVGLPGGVLAQTYDGVAWLPALQKARSAAADALADRADDPRAVLKKARLDREAGEFREAVRTLKRAKTIQDMPEIRAELRRTLLAELGSHPQRVERTAPRLERLAGTASQKIASLRAIAGAQRRSGRPVRALRSYFRLLGLNPAGEVTVGEGTQRRVVYPRYVQGAVADLFVSADETQRAQMRSLLQERLKRVRNGDDPFAVTRFAERFGRLPHTGMMRVRLDDEARVGSGFLHSQLTFLELSRAGDRRTAARALLKLAGLMSARRYPREAARHLRRLRDEFGDVRLDGDRAANVAARELNRTAPDDSSLRTSGLRWPAGPPTITESDGKPLNFDRIPVPVQAERGSLYDRLDVAIRVTSDGRRPDWKVGFRGGGYHGHWELSLPGSRSPFRFAYPLHRGWGLGHLLILQVGTELFGIAAVDESGEPKADILWRLDTLDDELPDLQGIRRRPAGAGGGATVTEYVDRYGRVIGTVGPVRPGYLCYQHKGRLVAVDPLTGSRLWERRDFPAESRLTGDDGHVLILQDDGRRVQVLRSIDGRTVAERSLQHPLEPAVMLRDGCAVVAREGQQAFSLLRGDLVAETVTWRRGFAAGARAFGIDGDAVGVIEPDGTVHVLRTETGTTLAEFSIERPDRLTGLHAAADGRRVFLVFSAPVEDAGKLRFRRRHRGYRVPLVNGVLCALDRRDGKLLWKRRIRDAGFPLDIPKGVPVLLLHDWRNSEGGDSSGHVSVFRCLDKRNGRPLHEIVCRETAAHYVLDSDRDRGTIDVRYPRGRVRLGFDNKSD